MGRGRRRRGRDRQEHERLRVRRRDRRHRLRADVPRGGDVRHRLRRPRRHVPARAPAHASGVPDHARARGPHRRPAVRAADFPGVPLYASTLARGLLGIKIKEHKLHNNPLLRARGRRDGRARARSARRRSASATPSPMRWASRCAHRSGTIVHTGDFKFDHTPGRRQAVRLRTPSRSSASEGVLCLLSDSTRAESPGYTPSERTVGEAFREHHGGRSRAASSSPPSPATSRASSRSSTRRATFDRKVTVIGRSMEQNVRIATRARLSARTRRTCSCRRTASRTIPDDQLVIATTGAQGEPMAGLARMANRDHRWIEIEPGDTVIVSASPIPGNEEVVGAHHRQPLQGRRQRLLPRHQARPRLGPRQPGRAQADAQPDPAASTSSRSTASSGCSSSTAGWRRAGRRARRTSSSSRTASRSSSRRRHRRAAARRGGRLCLRRRAVRRRGRRRRPARPARPGHDGMFLVVVTVDKQTGNLIGRPEIVTRGFVAGAGRAADRRRRRSRRSGHRKPGRPHQRGRRCSRSRSRTRFAVPVRADQAPADGLPRGGRGLAHAPWPTRTTRRTRSQHDALASAGSRVDAPRPSRASLICRRTSRAR